MRRPSNRWATFSCLVLIFGAIVVLLLLLLGAANWARRDFHGRLLLDFWESLFARAQEIIKKTPSSLRGREKERNKVRPSPNNNGL